jgi:perosamine synthetase
MRKHSSTKPNDTKAFIPLCVPEVRGKEWSYIKECLDTGWVSSVGGFVDRFEKMVAETVGVAYAVATTSGTAALHVALRLAGIASGDEVLIPTLTFIAPANAVRYVGAYPVFMDVEQDYWQMDPQKVRDFLTQECAYRSGSTYNKSTGRQVKAIVPVHLLGHPCDMDLLGQIAEEFDLKVVEDATESLGSTYRGRPMGSFGALGCLSFNGNKIITTGGGGAITTNSEAMATRARYLTTQAKDDPFEFVHNEIGYNYRLTNIQAAMGVAQLEQLTSYMESKRKITQEYNSQLSCVDGFTLPKQAAWSNSNCWMYSLLVDAKRYGQSSRGIAQRLKLNSIESRPFWMPVHRQVPFQDCQAYRIEVADRLYTEGLSLPCSVGLSSEQQSRVIAELVDPLAIRAFAPSGSKISVV